MSTSLIKHALGLRGSDYVRQDFITGNIIIKVQPPGDLIHCPCCRSRNIIRHGFAERWVQTVPIGFKPVWLVVPVQRVGCGNCGVVRLIDIQIARAEASEIRSLQIMARTLVAYRFGILAYYDHPISSGPIEGTNNKIKTLKRQAYGYRDTELFKLRIMGIHEPKYALTG